MRKRKCWSDLFGRYLKPEEKDYEAFVETELLYRIDKLEYEGDDCMEGSKDLKRNKDYHNKLKNR